MIHFSVVDYGARGDGDTVNTVAIRNAVDACVKAGGGAVVVPTGRFITGPIELHGNVTLHLEAGAVLEGSKDICHYQIDGNKRGLIYAADTENVAITGLGTIQGNGSAFMTTTPKPLENTTGRYSRQGKAYQAGTADGPMAMDKRPGSLILFSNCQNVAILGVTIKDAPEWTIHISGCDGAHVRGVKILNNPLIPNNDGIHCVTSRNVRISDCDVRAGDDAIAITGLWGKPGALAENITVANCTLQSRSSGVRVGYGSNSVRRCTFENLVIHDSNRGLGVFVRDEGSVSDILFSNIIINTRLHTGDWWGNGEPIHVSRIPQRAGKALGRIERIRFSNILANSEHGIVVYGEPDRMIRDLAFDRIRLKITQGPLNDRYGGNFDLRPAYDDPHSLFAHDIPGLYARYVKGLRIHDFKLEWADNVSPLFSHGVHCEHFSGLELDGFEGRQALLGHNRAAIALSHGRDVTIRDCKASPGTETFLAHSNLVDARLFVGNDLIHAQRVMLPEPSDFKLHGNLWPNRSPEVEDLPD